jgi:hypothetical protein
LEETEEEEACSDDEEDSGACAGQAAPVSDGETEGEPGAADAWLRLPYRPPTPPPPRRDGDRVLPEEWWESEDDEETTVESTEALRAGEAETLLCGSKPPPLTPSACSTLEGPPRKASSLHECSSEGRTDAYNRRLPSARSDVGQCGAGAVPKNTDGGSTAVSPLHPKGAPRGEPGAPSRELELPRVSQ